MTALLPRLTAGRFDGDNAEVLSVLQFAPKYPIWYTSPRPLDSVDDALRLVPEGWVTLKAQQSLDGSKWRWKLESADGVCTGEGPTAAHALTLAILRAKEDGRG